MPTFKQARVLITGGLGFIGSNLAIRMVERGAHSYEHFHKATGWKPKIPLENGLNATIDFYEEHLGKYIPARKDV